MIYAKVEVWSLTAGFVSPTDAALIMARIEGLDLSEELAISRAEFEDWQWVDNVNAENERALEEAEQLNW